MTRPSPLAAVLLALALVVGSCSSGDGDGDAARDPSTSSSTSTTVATTSTTAAPTTTTAPPPPITPTVPPGDVRALVTPTGVVAPVLAVEGAAYRVHSPCGREVVVTGGTPLYGATVVLDPGHGGVETGAVGANGLAEKDLNPKVVEHARRALEAAGAVVVPTRTADYRITLQTRAEIARRLAPRAFVSVHYNGGSDGPSDRPGTETFFQVANPESRRLAGLIYEEVFADLARFDGIAWEADRDAGAKFRTNDSGGDYYGILRHTAGLNAVLSEGAFLSNPPEAELLARPEVQQSQGEAIARGIIRFLTTDDPGSGYTQPYPRTEPAGPGGGATGCVDPPLT